MPIIISTWWTKALSSPSRPTPTTSRFESMESQFSFNTRFGQEGLGPLRDWSIEITGLVNGRLWYNSEEHLLIPAGQVANVTVFEEKPYTVWNMKGEIKVTDKLHRLGQGEQHFQSELQSDSHRVVSNAMRRQSCLGQRFLRQFNARPRNHRRTHRKMVMGSGARLAVLAMLAVSGIFDIADAAGVQPVTVRDALIARHDAGAAAAHHPDLRLERRDGGGARPRRPHRRHRGLHALSAGGL